MSDHITEAEKAIAKAFRETIQSNFEVLREQVADEIRHAIDDCPVVDGYQAPYIAYRVLDRLLIALPEQS